MEELAKNNGNDLPEVNLEKYYENLNNAVNLIFSNLSYFSYY